MPDFCKSLRHIHGYKTELSVASNGCKTRIICYIKDTVKYERTYESAKSNLILLQIDRSYSVQQVIGVYRAFKIAGEISLHERTKKMLKEITDFLKEDQTCFLLGDLNLDFAKKNCPEYRHRTIYNEWLEMALAFDLKQMVEEITWERLHVNELRSSILDHAYTNNLESIKEVVVKKQEVSDHSLIRTETGC